MAPRRVNARNSLSMQSGRQKEKRRHHSRLGCKTCKGRKVKCDERRPLCSNCARSSLFIDHCDFEPLSPQQYRKRSSTLSISDSDTAVELSCTGNRYPRNVLRPSLTWRPQNSSDASRIMELRLMYHYSLNTCHELPDRNDDRGRKMWTLEVPKMAFTYDFTLSALLSLSALHLASLAPHDQSLVDAFHYYSTKSVTQYRDALERADAATAGPLVATALLTALRFWVSSYNTLPDTGTPATPYLQCCALMHGSLQMFFGMRDWLRGTDYEWFWEKSLKAEGAQYQDTPFSTAYRRSLNLILATIDDATPPDDKEVYVSSTKFLNQLCRAFASGRSSRRVQWHAAMLPMIIPRKYYILLAREDPRALAIWAHNIALVHVIEHTWWLHGPKGNSVLSVRLRDTYDDMDDDWRFLMKLPIGIVFGDQATKV